MTLAVCFGGLALCAFAVLLLYGRELRRMAAWLRMRDERSNGRLTTEMPGPGFAAMARAVNEALDAADVERQQAAAEHRQFQRDLASLSHDIRTPLMGASGYVALATDEPDAVRRAHYLEAARTRLADMEGLLNALFAYARANDPDAELDLRPVVVLPALAGVLAGQFPAFEERGWEPAVRFADEAFTVEADAEALVRMFENLVSNALRYGTSAPAIVQEGRTVVFSNTVTDPEALDASRLFQRFYRADVARARGGAGLGLAVVSSLATAQGIEVAASLEGDVLAITLEFPAAL
ncbi:HAMP domain-containing sensor histidine kinase [Adlercreutzia sp. R21]|uniref:Sensor-like histidine kinase SenX3 n=1 Tax=Adlercreutzia wanghongyangiae TaxID=3111451 RepID=A0ABU6IEJ1_9ACTN|nr:HAMP domain-containing sensor histidine kinase [Adlercreutzia sp. R21]MEC4174858.1 HAMP domain-containing sensor histidine kinase [Adlercreutzia sp. R7]MEC4185180.1 HAMP domain-containing sensor histidine kinase [Adlercreutzia sp. R21]